MLPLRRVEIRRHAAKGTDLSGDSLSPEGIAQAHALGRSLRVGYTHLYSSGAQRATQTLACILAGMGRAVMNGVVIRPGLAAPREEEWRSACRAAGTTNLDKIVSTNEQLVRTEAERLGAELRAIFAELPEGSYALVVGHSPLSECAVYGLTGKLVTPALKECEGILVAEYVGGRWEVDDLR